MKSKKSKSNQPKRKWLVLGGIFLTLLILFWNRHYILDWYYFGVYQTNPNNHPTQTFVPKNYSIVGADISRYQEKFLWDRAKILNQYKDTLPLRFIIAKATEGTRLADPLYQYNYAQAQKYPNIIFGAYHFFHPDKNVTQQADFFVNTAQLKKGNMLPVIDIEQRKGQSNKVIRERLNLFCNLLENKYGKKPIIYSNKEFLINIIGDEFKGYPIWVAHYGVKDLDMPSPWDWKIWQLTDEGSSFGTTHHIDINVLNGSKRALEKLRIEQ